MLGEIRKVESVPTGIRVYYAIQDGTTVLDTGSIVLRYPALSAGNQERRMAMLTEQVRDTLASMLERHESAKVDSDAVTTAMVGLKVAIVDLGDGQHNVMVWK